MKQKRCSYKLHKGERLISIDRFGVDKSTVSGLCVYCKACNASISAGRRKTRTQKQIKDDKIKSKNWHKQYYPTHKSEIRSRERKRQQQIHIDRTGLERYMIMRAKGRAKEKGIKFTITKFDIVVPKRCPVLGIPIKPNKGNGPSPNSPSLDRINPKKGYVKGNVIVISHKANTIKSFGTPDDHFKIYKFYSKIQK